MSRSDKADVIVVLGLAVCAAFALASGDRDNGEITPRPTVFDQTVIDNGEQAEQILSILPGPADPPSFPFPFSTEAVAHEEEQMNVSSEQEGPGTLSVSWSRETTVQADESAVLERLPRIIMLSASWCGPCRRTKRDAADLIGDGPDAVVQVIDVEERRNYPDEFNVVRTRLLPSFFVYRGDGTRIGRVQSGSMTRQQLVDMAAGSGVSLDPLPEPQKTQHRVTASVPASLSFGRAVQVLAEHLAVTASAEEHLVSGLFDISVDVPDLLPEILGGLTQQGVWSSEELGLAVTLPSSTTITMQRGEIQFSDPIDVQWRRGPVSASADLHAVSVSDNGKSVTLDLRGRGILPVPDLTVVFE